MVLWYKFNQHKVTNQKSGLEVWKINLNECDFVFKVIPRHPDQIVILQTTPDCIHVSLQFGFINSKAQYYDFFAVTLQCRTFSRDEAMLQLMVVFFLAPFKMSLWLRLKKNE